MNYWGRGGGGGGGGGLKHVLRRQHLSDFKGDPKQLVVYMVLSLKSFSVSLLRSVLFLLIFMFKQYFILNHFLHYILHDIVNQDSKTSHMAYRHPLLYTCFMRLGAIDRLRH